MKQTAAFFRSLMWIALVFTLGCHALTTIALIQNNQKALEQNQENAVFSLTVMLLGLGLLALGTCLCQWWKKRPIVGLILTVAGGILMAINTLRLAAQFPYDGTGVTERGMTAVKLLVRHWSSLLVPLSAALYVVLTYLPVWRTVPTAIRLPEPETADETPVPKGAVLVQCPRCEASFHNGESSMVFRCPYCRKKLQMPGKSWDGKKKKRSLLARERKARAAGEKTAATADDKTPAADSRVENR